MAFATKYDQVQRELAEAKALERKIQRESLLYTFLTMLVLAAWIILWLHIPPQNPPMPDAVGGMDIIQGTDLVGMNDTKDPVMAGAPQKQEASQPTPQTPQPEAQASEPPITNDGDVEVKKTPVVPQKQPVKPNPTPTPNPKPSPTPEKKPERQSNKKFEFDGNNSKTNGNNGPGGTNKNKGNGYTPGNQGDPNGIKDGGWQKYGNGTEGTGKGAHLGGRKAESLPEPDCSNPREGKDIVKIVVDNNGRIIEAHGGIRGSTITDNSTIECDEIAAKKSRFNVDPKAPPSQTGTIVYIHKLQ